MIYRERDFTIKAYIHTGRQGSAVRVTLRNPSDEARLSRALADVFLGALAMDETALAVNALYIRADMRDAVLAEAQSLVRLACGPAMRARTVCELIQYIQCADSLDMGGWARFRMGELRALCRAAARRAARTIDN